MKKVTKVIFLMLMLSIQKIYTIYTNSMETSFLLEIKKLEKTEKIVTNLQDKTDYVAYIINLKQVLNYG